jgi:hypothetical protein
VDPVSLIVAALAAGAVAGAQNTATEAVRDAYTGLKDLVRRRLSGRKSGEAALARHEQNPDDAGGVLGAELVAVRAGDDAAILEGARRLMALLDPTGFRAGKFGTYEVDLRGAQGVQVGDGNSQINTFPAPPASA